MLTCTACLRQTKVPEGIIPKEKMAELLLAIHIAEAKTNEIRLFTADSTARVYKFYESTIFKKYHITPKTYRKSYDFYISHPELINDVYSIVVDSLNARKSTLRID